MSNIIIPMRAHFDVGVIIVNNIFSDNLIESLLDNNIRVHIVNRKPGTYSIFKLICDKANTIASY